MFFLLIGFVLGAGTIIFALQNTAVVTLTFFGSQFDSSLALVIIVAALAGGILGLLGSFPSIVARSFRISGLTKENRGLRDEAETLRQMNIKQQETLDTTQSVS